MFGGIYKNMEMSMNQRMENLQLELSKVRTGRANPNLLDHVVVSYYGNNTPLNQVASITVLDARTLSVSPWEKNLVPTIEKAILQSNLGINPVTVGSIIRIPMPPLTEERRKELVKIVRQTAEETRIAIRNIRRDTNEKIKSLFKDKKMAEDEVHRAENDIQKLTDKFIHDIDQLLTKKETDLMTI